MEDDEMSGNPVFWLFRTQRHVFERSWVISWCGPEPSTVVGTKPGPKNAKGYRLGARPSSSGISMLVTSSPGRGDRLQSVLRVRNFSIYLAILNTETSHCREHNIFEPCFIESPQHVLLGVPLQEPSHFCIRGSSLIEPEPAFAYPAVDLARIHADQVLNVVQRIAFANA